MNTGPKEKILNDDNSRPVTAEQRLTQLGIKLPPPPEPFGIYAEAVQTGNMLFLTGMLPTVGREAKFIGRIGGELDVKTGHMAAYLAAVNAPARYRQMDSPSFTEKPVRKTRRRFSCCTDFRLPRGCSILSSPSFPIATTLSRRTIPASDTATGQTR